jgi:osmotically-inducible protein OsmY
MKKYIIIAGLLLGISGISAFAQSTTPGVPEPSSPNPPSPQATAPDQQSGTDRDHDRSSSDQQQYPDTKDKGSARDQIQAALQQRSKLAGVNVDEAESRIVLSGSVGSDDDRREAERIAQSYAHGREVVNHIQVNGKS